MMVDQQDRIMMVHMDRNITYMAQERKIASRWKEKIFDSIRKDNRFHMAVKETIIEKKGGVGNASCKMN